MIGLLANDPGCMQSTPPTANGGRRRSQDWSRDAVIHCPIWPHFPAAYATDQIARLIAEDLGSEAFSLPMGPHFAAAELELMIGELEP